MFKKFLFAVFLLALCSVPAGAQSLCSWRDTISNSQGQVIPNATVIVLAGTTTGAAAVNTLVQPGTPLATIYQDPYGATVINQATNPINTSGGDGTFQFWGTCGAYVVIQAYGPGIYGQYVYGVTLGGGSASSGCAPSNNNGNLLYKSGVGCVGALGISTFNGSTLQVAGPEPWASITSPLFGSRATPAVVQTTASCNSTATVTVASGTGFINGDGITIYGCGATNTLVAPALPTVTSGISDTFTVPDAKLTTITGGSTYTYSVFAIDKNGGMTVPSTAKVITNGPTALGMSGPISVTSASLLGTTLTLTLPATNSLLANMLIHFTKSTVGVLSGYYTITSVSGGGETIVASGLEIQSTGSAITSTGGNIAYATGNQIAWTPVTGAFEYGICGQRPGDGSRALIGLSYPQGAQAYVSSSVFMDWGATITSKPLLPPYLSSTQCAASSPTNDYLSTTILSGAGTTSLVLANAASQTISGQTASLDIGPGFLAAAAAASQSISGVTGGIVLVPAAASLNFYYLFSRLDLTSFGLGLSVNQEGIIEAGEPIVGEAHWYGTQAAQSANQFQSASTPQIVCNGAWPCFYDPIGFPFIDHLAINASGNQALVMLFDGMNGPVQGGHLNEVNCSSGTTLDYSGMCLVVRPGPYNFNIDQNAFITGPGNGGSYVDTTWVPSLYFDNDPAISPFSVIDWHIRDFQGSARTTYLTSNCGTGQEDEFTHNYTQGGLMPLLTLQNIGSCTVGINLRMSEFTNDTSYTASLAILGGIGAQVTATDMYAPSAETAGQVPGWLTGRNINAGNFFATPVLAAGTYFAGSLQPVTIVSTIAAVSLADGFISTLAYNQEGTAGAAVAYTLPPSVAPPITLRKCVWNGYNGSAADTGALTLQTSGTGQYIVFTDGTLSASGGYVVSLGAAGDTACVTSIDATHWQLTVGNGSTWAKH